MAPPLQFLTLVKAIIWLFLLLIHVSVSGADWTGERGRCELFLRKYVPFAESGELRIPLENGDAGQFFNQSLLASNEIALYLKTNPNSPWAPELSKIDMDAFDRSKNVIYLSEIGATLWSLDDFPKWTSMADSSAMVTAEVASRLIVKLARGDQVEGISEVSRERVRNAHLAGAQGQLASLEAQRRLQNYLQQRERNPTEATPESLVEQLMRPPPEVLTNPITRQTEDLSRVAAEHRDAFVTTNYGVHSSVDRTHAEHEMRDSSPSLRIPFEYSPDILRADASTPISSFLVPTPNHRLVWIARILVREALVRRKLVLDGDKVITLGEVLDDDSIFLLAAHPEAAALWDFLPLEEFDIRHYDTTSAFDTYSLPALRINRDRDLCRFELHRTNWTEGAAEPLEFEMTLTTAESEESDCGFIDFKEKDRLYAWLFRKWTAYTTQVLTLPSEPIPTIKVNEFNSEVAIDFGANSAARVLGFYAYLAQLFPAVTPH